ncbi:MAG TPA: transposase, partial [Gaiellales bacterium]|nr:transposase [Gaiellales bacterium]
LSEWLSQRGVTHVAMEGTGVYWKPVYYVLEADFDVWLVNAQHVKNVPGRKTDTGDAAWLCRLLEHGLLRKSFVPPREIREIRDLTRYRKALIRGARLGGQPAAQGARGCRRQAGHGGIGHHRCLGPQDARRSGGRHD